MMDYYLFKVLCSGLTSTPNSLQRVMNQVFGSLIGWIGMVYIYDTLVMLKNPNDHLHYLGQELNKLLENHLSRWKHIHNEARFQLLVDDGAYRSRIIEQATTQIRFAMCNPGVAHMTHDLWTKLQWKLCFVTSRMPSKTNSSDLAPDRGIGHTARLEPWSLPTHNIPYKMSVNETDEVKKHVVVFLVRDLLLPNISSYGALVMFGHND